MLSRFSSIATPILSAKKVEVLSSQKYTISSLEREMDNKKDEASINKAMDFMQKSFSSKLDNNDFRKIKHELGLNLLNKSL